MLRCLISLKSLYNHKNITFFSETHAFRLPNNFKCFFFFYLVYTYCFYTCKVSFILFEDFLCLFISAVLSVIPFARTHIRNNYVMVSAFVNHLQLTEARQSNSRYRCMYRSFSACLRAAFDKETCDRIVNVSSLMKCFLKNRT